MIKLSEKSRRILRAVYRGLGVSAVSLMFQACYGIPIDDPGYAEYGMPPPYPVREEFYIHGYVKSKETNERIEGIHIWIKDITVNYNFYTNEDGRFYLYLPKQDNYTIVFTDVDGEENGVYKPLTLDLTREEIEKMAQLIIELEEVKSE